MLKIFTYQDREVLAGLTWGPSKPAGLLHRTPLTAMSLAANDLALHWEDRTAWVPQEAKYLGVASLLSVLVGHLSKEERVVRVIGSRVLCAFEIWEQDLFFAAVLVNGKPEIGAERLFCSSFRLINYIDVECINGRVDRLAIDPYLAEDIAEGVHLRFPCSYLCPSTASGPTSSPVRVEGKLKSHLPRQPLSFEKALPRHAKQSGRDRDA